MILIFHIIIALTSVVASTYAFISPSKTKIRASYGLVILTIASGTYLVISTHAGMLSSCITGLIYVGVVSLNLGVARHRLAEQKVRVDD
jgi:hypothetical protein